MLRLFGALLGIVAILVGYGFYEGYVERELSKTEFEARYRVHGNTMLFFDSYGYKPWEWIGPGTVLVRIDVNNTSDLVIRHVQVKGAVEIEGVGTVPFSEKCQRRNSVDLIIPLGARQNDDIHDDTEAMCYVKVYDLAFKSAIADDKVEAIEERVSRTRVTSIDVRAFGAKPPMRYVEWIVDFGKQAWSWLMFPFERA